MSTWTGRPATDIAGAVRAGDVPARTVVAEHLARVEALDGRFGAFRVVRGTRALAEADAVDAHPERAALPLAGVPLAVKDNTAVAGETIRSGSAATPRQPSTADHEVVRRLRGAGAVVLGLTSMPELGLFPMGDSVFGTARNPWCPERTPGGSSGGSAAAVAAGLVPVAQGNDGLGSLRIPAACCGLVGVKPGSGVVPPPFGDSVAPGEPDPWAGLAENGVLATTVADAALVLGVLAARPDWGEVPAPGGRLRIAVSTASGTGSPVLREIREAVGAAADTLAAAGHEVRRARPPYPPSLGVTVLSTWCASAADCVRPLDAAALQRPARAHARAGRVARRLGLPRPSARDRWRHRLDAFFAATDVLLTPVLAQLPPPALRWGERGWLPNVLAASRYSPFAAPWNLAGWPAIAVPAGRHASRHAGVQLVAPPGGEPVLLALARELESQHPWPRVAPVAAEPSSDLRVPPRS